MAPVLSWSSWYTRIIKWFIAIWCIVHCCQVNADLLIVTNVGVAGIMSNGTIAAVGTGAYQTEFSPGLVPSGPFLSVDCHGGSFGVNVCFGVRTNGSVINWGLVLASDTMQTNYPTTINNFVKVAMSTYIACALGSDRKLSCWGPTATALGASTFAGDWLDIDGVNDPYILGGTANIRGTVCGVQASGAIVCFCSNNDCTNIPTLSGGPYQSVAVGYNTVCGILADGTSRAVCSGTGSFTSLPTLLQSTGWLSLSLGGCNAPSYPSCTVTACGVKLDGRIACFGSVSGGQDTLAPATEFVEVAVPTRSGGDIVCGITARGKMECWGTTLPDWLSDTPSSAVFGVRARGFMNVEAGRGGGMTLDTNGHPYIFGGLGTAAVSTSPVLPGDYTMMPTGYTFSSISVGAYHACGIISSNNNVICWGGSGEIAPLSQFSGGYAAIINGSGATTSKAFSSISAGLGWTCGLLTSTSQALCWGRNGTGLVLTIPKINPPTTVYSQVSVGYAVACGIVTATGYLECWGAGPDPSFTPPSTVSFKQISCGFRVCCGIKSTDGDAYCWGNSAYLTTTIAGKGPFKWIAAGQLSHCGVRTSDGVIVCAGAGSITTNPILTPPRGNFTRVHLSKASGQVSQLEVGCGLSVNGEALCWGNPVIDSSETYPLSLPYHASGGQFRTSKTRIMQVDGTSGADAPFCGLSQLSMLPCRTLAYAFVAPAASTTVPGHLPAVWPMTSYQFVASGSYPVSGYAITLPGTTFIGTVSSVILTGTTGALSFDVTADAFGLQGVTVSGGTGVLLQQFTIMAVFQSVVFTGQQSSCGSSILSLFGSSSSITGCTFDSVSATSSGVVKDSSVANLVGQGGAVAIVYASTSISSCIFRNNYAYGGGAALYLLSSPNTLTISSSSFVNNIAAEGAAIVSSLSEGLIVTSTNFSSNTAVGAGASLNRGGSLMVEDNTALSLTNIRCSNSTAVTGGCIYVFNTPTSVTGSRIDGNRAFNQGGGLYLEASVTTVTSSSIGSNTLSSDVQVCNTAAEGGGVYCTSSGAHTLTISNSDVSNNNAALLNGGLSSDKATIGGAIGINDCPLSLNTVTLSSNTAHQGGAIGISRTSLGSTISLTGVTATSNNGVYGGGIFIRDITASLPIMSLTMSSFTSNTATRYGGSFFGVESRVAISSTSFTSNTAFGGGALYYEDSSVSCTSCTYTTNTASGWGNDVATLAATLVASSAPSILQSSSKSFTPPLIVELRDQLNQRVVPLTRVVGTVTALNSTISGYLGAVSKLSNGTGQVVYDIGMTGDHLPNQVSSIAVDVTSFLQVRKTLTTYVGVTLRQCAAGEYNLAQVCTVCETGKYSNNTITAESSSCVLCPAGTFAGVTNQTVCQQCDTGSYAGVAGSSVCTQCASGKYALNKGSLECTSCETGKFNTITGSTQLCTSCDAGKFANNVGLTICTACEPGSSSNAAAGTCDPCGAGRYAPTNSSSSCTPCGQGKYAPSVGASVCQDCQSGTYSINSGTGNIFCTPCGVGTIAPYSGATSCVPCTAGTYAATTGSIQCTPCARGSYTSVNGSSICTPCVAGYYMNVTNATVCTQCETGKFQSSGAQSFCSLCQAGSFYSPLDTSTCQACPAGRASSTSGAANCTDCAPGFYTGLTGQQSCLPCDLGRYTDTSGNVQCTFCELGKYQSLRNATSCDPCPEGSKGPNQGLSQCPLCAWGTFANVTGLVDCYPCPATTYGTGPGNQNCTKCPGSTSSSAGALKCFACTDGQEATQTGDCITCLLGQYANIGTPCTNCSAGTYALSTPVGKCTDCGPGRYLPYTGRTECLFCTPGTFAKLDGSANCTACPTGTYGNATGLAACTAVPRGNYAPYEGMIDFLPCPPGTTAIVEGRSVCDNCTAGYYSDRYGAAECTAAERGNYVPYPGANMSIPCPLGYYAPSIASVSCIPCEFGKYGPTTGLSICTYALEGYHVNQTGATDQVACAKGYYSDSTGRSECLPCSTGTYAAAENSKTCTPAPINSYVNEVARTDSIPCAAGTYAPTTGLTICANCTAGTSRAYGAITECVACDIGSASEASSAQCTSCLRGYYADKTSATVCSICDEGKYTNVPGSDQCTNCLAGYIANITGATECSTCQAGTYQSLPGKSSCDACIAGTAGRGTTPCEACPKNFVAPREGLSACLQCSTGATSMPATGGTRCWCPTGKVQEASDGELNVDCADCPTGGVCPEGTSYTNMATAAGYYRINGTVPTFVECINRDSCPGGDFSNQCGDTREGAMCGQCRDGRTEWSGQCIVCNKANPGYVILFLIVTFLGALFFWRTSQVSTGQMKVFFFFVQTAVVIVAASQSSLRWMDFFNFQPGDSAPLCIAPLDPYDKILLSLMVPLILVGEMIIIMAIARGMWEYKAKQRAALPPPPVPAEPIPEIVDVNKREEKWDWNPWIRGFSSLFVFSYTMVARTTFRFLKCVKVGDQSIVYSTPAINCSETRYKNWLVAMYFLIVVYVVAAPLCVLASLWRFRGRRLQASAARWGVFFDPYARHCFWFETVSLYRRSMYVAVDVLLYDEPLAKYMVFAVITALLLMFHLWLKPFKDHTDNMVESVSLAVLMVLSLILGGYQESPDSTVQALVFILVGIPTIFGVLWIAIPRGRRFIQICVSGMAQVAMQRRSTRSQSESRLELESTSEIAMAVTPN